ncbi:unnamed protein product [Gordionus sp. m RMFG-2023]
MKSLIYLLMIFVICAGLATYEATRFTARPNSIDWRRFTATRRRTTLNTNAPFTGAVIFDENNQIVE